MKYANPGGSLSHWWGKIIIIADPRLKIKASAVVQSPTPSLGSPIAVFLLGKKKTFQFRQLFWKIVDINLNLKQTDAVENVYRARRRRSQRETELLAVEGGKCVAARLKRPSVTPMESASH